MTDKKELYKLLAKSKKEDPEAVSVTIFEDGSVETSAPNPARAELRSTWRRTFKGIPKWVCAVAILKKLMEKRGS